MKQLLSFVETYWRLLLGWLSLVNEVGLALPVALALLSAMAVAACLTRLRRDADAEINEIDRSLNQEIDEIKRCKELLRDERIRQIRAKLHEKLRQMLLAFQDRIKQREACQAQQEKLLRIPIPHPASPDHAVKAVGTRFNSFIAPANSLSASMVEIGPESGKKFASA